jgi:hypothetical protein
MGASENTGCLISGIHSPLKLKIQFLNPKSSSLNFGI